VDALDIPPLWRGRLKRHFWRPGYFKELLERLSSGAAPAAQKYLAHLGNATPAEARAALDGMMDYLGASETTLGGRTREEIVDRLLEQAAEAAAVRLDKKAVALIERVLTISGDGRNALTAMRKVLREARVKLDAPLDAMEARMEALDELGLGKGRIAFAANFGRNMEYYTGFVFELWSRDAEGKVQIAGGGRYDTLLQSLGGKQAIPAIGCAIRGERVHAARTRNTRTGNGRKAGGRS
jgi:ATP phosphoribosyltransferase regulatory subunit